MVHEDFPPFARERKHDPTAFTPERGQQRTIETDASNPDQQILPDDYFAGRRSATHDDRREHALLQAQRVLRQRLTGSGNSSQLA